MNNSIINAQESRGFLNMHPKLVLGCIYMWGWTALSNGRSYASDGLGGPGGSCKLNKPAKLYVSKDGEAFFDKSSKSARW